MLLLVLQSAFFCIVLCSMRWQVDGSQLSTAQNPFVYLNQLGYYYENHTVITEDGYRLLLVRIPHDRNNSASNTPKPVILFHHGALCSFNDFLIAGPGISFGFKAVEEGYDVFFLNARGNRWSRNHINLDPDLNANAFWNFSFHELGLYDVSTSIDYILDITEQSKLSYVGHSQGCAAFLALTSTRPEYNNKITLAVFLAPAAYLGNTKYFLLTSIKGNIDTVKGIVETLHLNELAPYTDAVSETGKMLCSPSSPLLWLCKELFYGSFGPSGQINSSAISAFITNFPAGGSFKQLIHFGQNSHTGEFRLYDYGSEGNLIEYGQNVPPDYNLGAVTTPVALYYGLTDYISSAVDVARLGVILPNVVRNVLVSLVPTNHLDLLIGTLTEQLVTKPALDVLNEYNNL